MLNLRIANTLVMTSVLFLSSLGSALAAQKSLAQSPAGAAREPAPNVIVSVDDSGSMGAAGIATLKAALTQTFASSNVADDRVRLAWQSMNRCRGIPSSDAACGSLNGMKRLSGTHRSNFMTWVNGLTASGPTPSHIMVDEAGKYLSATNLGADSPWASNPGTTELPLLSCRKSFHIFMTDGNWNGKSLYADDNYKDAVDTSNNRIIRGGGNADGTAKTLPDNTAYSVTSDQTRLYRDSWGSASISTLSDVAFHYWSTDLQPSLTNNVRKSPKDQLPDENFGTTADPANLETYWNPRNNPATWQHMVNYSIGFNAAASWQGSPTWAGDTFTGLAPLIRGDTSWPTPLCGDNNSGTGNKPCDKGTGYFTASASPLSDARMKELWHMALNSRGRFVPAPDAQALVDAFQGIMGDILSQTANPLVSIATSSSRLRTDGSVYVAGFTSERWSGELGAYTVTAGTNAVAATPSWTASTSLDTSTFSVSNRLVITAFDATPTVARSFVWGSLSTAQQAAIKGADGDTVGAQRVNFIRGDRSQETQNGGALRRRDSRLGDIINSNIWLTGKPSRMSFEHNGHATFRSTYASRTPTLYVGANDGMLHAFDATTGTERLAYVPLAAYPNLREYTLASYGHKYFVDGHPFSGDADVSFTTATTTVADWRTLLVSGLGGGGRGYFILDVTSPGAFSTASLVIDKSFPGSVTSTTTEKNDIGHIYSLPVVDPVSGSRSEQIVKLNNQRWAVVMGNGVNSYNERPVLLIQYLDGDRSLKRIIANSTTGGGNGLSAPRLIDINGNGTMDIAYAGDLLGNVWKFNLTSTSDANWGVSDWTGGTTYCSNATTCSPLFVAVDGSNNRQPITAAPLWMAHPMGGIQVLVGTGINVTESDRSNTSTQSIYSVWDKGLYSAASTGVVTVVDQGNISATDTRSSLVTQTVLTAVTTTVAATTTTTVSTDYYNTSQNNVTYSWTVSTAKRGWFMDLPESRERVLSNPQIFEGQKIIVSSHIPKLGATGETCDFDTVTEDNWINVLNMITGKPAVAQVFNSTDPVLNANLKYATRTRFGSGEYVSINKNNGGLDLISLKNDDPSCPQGQLCTDKKTLTTGTVPGARADWREIR